MSEYTMGAVEMRFAEIIWEHEPVSSGELVKLCEQELNWKKSTTYTVLRRLCQKGIFICRYFAAVEADVPGETERGDH